MQIAKWLRECKLTYAVPRQFPEPWPYFTLVVYVIATTIFVLLAFLNAALVGYETVTELHPNFNITQSFWFDRFRPGGFGLLKPGTLCDPQTINPGDRFTTNYSLFEWDLMTVGGQAGKSLVYKGSPLQSCDVCAQYMDARVQEYSTDLTTLICCDDVDGSSVLAKTTFSLTMLNGTKYAPPVLGAIPEHVRYMMPAESPRSSLLNTMLQYANEDFAGQLGDIFRRNPSPYPVIISMYIFSHPCPASNQKCELTEDQGLTVIYSDGSRKQYNDFYQALPLIKRPPPRPPYPAISNLAHTMLASVQIDLGNPSPSNFLLNQSMVDATIFRQILSPDARSGFFSGLYDASITAQPLTLQGSATIQALYSCRMQLVKPIGSAVVSVMVATLSMFMSGWAMFIFLSSEYAERKRESELGGQVGPHGYHYRAPTMVIGVSETSSDDGGVEDLEHQ